MSAQTALSREGPLTQGVQDMTRTATRRKSGVTRIIGMLSALKRSGLIALASIFVSLLLVPPTQSLAKPLCPCWDQPGEPESYFTGKFGATPLKCITENTGRNRDRDLRHRAFISTDGGKADSILLFWEQPNKRCRVIDRVGGSPSIL